MTRLTKTKAAPYNLLKGCYSGIVHITLIRIFEMSQNTIAEFKCVLCTKGVTLHSQDFSF